MCRCSNIQEHVQCPSSGYPAPDLLVQMMMVVLMMMTFITTAIDGDDDDYDGDDNDPQHYPLAMAWLAQTSELLRILGTDDTQGALPVPISDFCTAYCANCTYVYIVNCILLCILHFEYNIPQQHDIRQLLQSMN